MLWHTLFDLLALLCGVSLGAWFRRRYALAQPVGIESASQQHYYLAILLLGLALGSVLLGSWNLWLAGGEGLAKSLAGGLLGAIVAAELFKYFSGISRSTGLYFVPGLLALIVVGRIGCFFGGLADYTYGIPTDLPWGVDFGDGLRRHPVQLYEALSMLLLLLFLLFDYPWRSAFWLRHGFYLFVLVYAGQRFVWEFLKPYPPLVGGLNLFHLVSLALLAYAFGMLYRSWRHAE